MNLVRQPKGSNLCGQACVATLCEITLDEAIMLTRKRGKTRTCDLKQALRAMGMSTAERRKVGMPDRHETALLFFKSKDGKWCHWVLWHKGKYYDPQAGVFRKLPRYLEDADMASHLRVYFCGEKVRTGD